MQDTTPARLSRMTVWVLKGMLDVVLPPRCVGCRASVDRQGDLCAACWLELTFIEGAVCDACGFPFEVDPGPEALCGACVRRRPAFSRARSVVRYDEASRNLILAFKHGDRTELAVTFGRWMARAGDAMLTSADLVVPVPLHWRRLLPRRYNQAALLAFATVAAAGRGILVGPRVLKRRRNDPSQSGRSASERRANVAAAFAVVRGQHDRIQGRRVVVVDDVYTTGATAEACARVLLAGGAAAVSVLTLGRVVRGNSEPI